MKNNLYFQQVKFATVQGVKTLWIFGLVSMTVWIVLLTLWTNAVYLYDWNVYNSLVLFTFSACAFLSVAALGVVIISSIFVFYKQKTSILVNSIVSFMIAILLTRLASFIIWAVFYAGDGSYSVGELSSNPLFVIPNILTIMMLLYIGWKVNKLTTVESEVQ